MEPSEEWSRFCATSISGQKRFALIPRDPKSIRFARDVDDLAQRASEASPNIERLATELDEAVDAFAKWQQTAIDDLIGQLDTSLRDLVSTLDDALDNGDEMAEAAQSSSRTLRYIDHVTDFNQLKTMVVRETTQLMAAVQAHALRSTEIHQKYKREIDVMRERLDEAQSVARTDHLTKLPNRTAHEFYLHAAIAKAKDGAPFALALLDLNDFKSINDTYGHGAGDLALVAMANSLKACLGKDGFVSRLAGDEFTVVYRGSAARLTTKLEQFDAYLEENPLSLGPEESITIGACYGVCDLDGKMDYSSVMKLADERMYARKRANKAGLRAS